MDVREYSQMKYHLENLKGLEERAKNRVNLEDVSANALIQCMKKRLNEVNLEEEYNKVKRFAINGVEKIETEKLNFFIFEEEIYIEEFLNEHQEYSAANIIKDIPVFLNDENGLYVPEDELNIPDKPYVYLGRYYVLIGH